MEGVEDKKNFAGSDLSALWNTVCGEAELLIEPSSFTTFWGKSKLIGTTESSLTIEVNNIFAKSQFEKKFAGIIASILMKHGYVKPTLKFITAKNREKNSEEEVAIVATPAKSAKGNFAKNSELFRSNLNNKYQFANFVVGSSNDLAYAAAQAAAEHPGERYNPIFIYGGVGLGKTHLIQAVGNEISRNFPEKKVLYVSTETFVNDFINFLRNKTPQKFTEKYREIDALIIDDFQFIAGKTANMEAFFNTFNALHQANTQLVIAADKPPAAIPTLPERLRSRLLMGMAIDVNLPDYETRVAIIQTKSANSSVKMSTETMEFLANNIKTNVRELEGALNQILAYAEMQNITPTPEFAAELLSSSRISAPKHLTSRMIVEKIAKYFELKPADITSAARDKYIAFPRQICMYLLRTELKMSFPQIARELGRKDHTTAMSSIKKIEREIQLDITVREKINACRGVIYE
jgi:chromosomal replication initiator protein